ncbi:hypothetical protein IAT38_005020 [Cryptococcus sp. DSM 104549]
MSSSITLTTSINPPTSPIRILYISPTTNLPANHSKAALFSPLLPVDVHVAFYNPPKGPRSIDGARDGAVSATEVLRDLGLDGEGGDEEEGVGGNSRGKVFDYDAIVVGCFSAHPLVPALRECLPPRSGDGGQRGGVPPVISLFEVGVCFALQLGGTFGIVTTGRQWEPLFDEAIRAMGISSSRYKGTRGCGHNAVSLEGQLDGVVATAKEVVGMGARVIILGCGGMTAMRAQVEEALEQECGRYIPVVDGVQAAVDQAIAFARMRISAARP